MHDRSSTFGREIVHDALSDVLGDFRFSGLAYGYCEMGSPWGVEFPAESAVRMHFVLSGACCLKVEAGWLPLNAGDAVLLPQGAEHLLADSPRSRTRPIGKFPITQIGERAHKLKFGRATLKHVLVCCAVRADDASFHPLLNLMPPVVILRRAGTEDNDLAFLLNAVATEFERKRVGAAALVARLADIAFIRLIRLWLESTATVGVGWLAGIRDPHLGRVLATIHRNPKAKWTLSRLATIAGISRSHFAARFASVIGIPPAQYIASWRMQIARELLKTDGLRVSEVAYRLGYDSEASFSRAFKRALGVPPSQVRTRA